jgi:hypothetical protein
MMLAGIIGVALAVVLLRQTQESAPSGDSKPTTFRPAPTTVEQRAEPGIVLPEAGEPPADVGTVQAEGGDGRLRLRWGQAISGATPRGATGYHVSWGPGGRLDRHLLVAAPELELRGLANGTRYDVEVRSVDAYGQRSPPVRGSAVPSPDQPNPWRQAFTGLYDDFRSGPVPDPDRWAVQRIGNNCLRAGPGQDEEAGRLVLELRCGSTSAVLRARVPLRLTGGDVFARIGLVTDGPIPGGQVAISLVPGPVAMLGVPPEANLRPAEPGHAVDDPNLPPGTIRAVIDANQAAIIAGPAVPRTLVSANRPATSTVLGSPGVTSRWELELASSGVTLRRDGQLTATGNVQPGWTEATVLFEFTAPAGEVARLHLDAVGFTGQTSAPPKIVDILDAITIPRIYEPADPAPNTMTLPAAPGQWARLHAVIGPVRDCHLAGIAADFGGSLVPMDPIMPGATPAGGPYCPLAASLPVDLLDLLRRGVLHTPFLRSDESMLPVAGGFLEIGLAPGTAADRARVGRVGQSAAVPAPGPRPASDQHRLPQLSAELRDAAGDALVPGAPVERGRLVLDVALDGLTGQRTTGQVGGVAGIQVLLDNQIVAGLPTTRDGPAAGGSYQFGMSLNKLSPGSHTIQVRVYGTESGTRPHNNWINFQLR